MNCEYIRKTKARQTANTISQKSSMQTENAWTTPEILPTARQTYGYDTSKVNIYLCDEDEYMNELKGYYFSEDYEEKKKTKTYEEYIAEHAVYHKEITFDK